jgi:hypothetical protein
MIAALMLLLLLLMMMMTMTLHSDFGDVGATELLQATTGAWMLVDSFPRKIVRIC